jgi:hypothetical protein
MSQILCWKRISRVELWVNQLPLEHAVRSSVNINILYLYTSLLYLRFKIYIYFILQEKNVETIY